MFVRPWRYRLLKTRSPRFWRLVNGPLCSYKSIIMSIASNLVFIRDIYVTLLYCRGYEIQDRLKLITNKNKKLILGVTVVYDFQDLTNSFVSRFV